MGNQVFSGFLAVEQGKKVFGINFIES